MCMILIRKISMQMVITRNDKKRMFSGKQTLETPFHGVVLAGKIKSVFCSFHMKLEAQGTSSIQVSSSKLIAGEKLHHPRNLQSLSLSSALALCRLLG